MSRVSITEAVLEQLETAVRSGQIDDPVARYEVQALAFDRDYDELVEFISTADAATYFEAVSRVSDVSPRDA